MTAHAQNERSLGKSADDTKSRYSDGERHTVQTCLITCVVNED